MSRSLITPQRSPVHGFQARSVGLRRPLAKMLKLPVLGVISSTLARFTSASRPLSAMLLFEPTPT